LEAANTVAGHDNHDDVLEPMASLLEKSLVLHADQCDDEPRFTMLETIREFSLEQLQAGGEADQVRRAHAAWCVELAARAESELYGPGQTRWLARLNREYDNLRAALRLTQREGDDALLLRLAGSLGIFWQIHGHVAEGASWVDPALDRGASVAPAVRAQAFFTSGLLAWVSGDYARGIERCAASVKLWQTVEDPWRVAFSLNVLGMLRGEQGDAVGARRDLETSLTMCQAIGHEWGIGLGMFDLGKVLTYVRDYDAARSLIESSLAHFRATGDRWQIAEALADLGGLAQVRGDVDRVAVLAAESLRLNREQGWLWYVPESLELLGGVALVRREHARAARLLGTAEARREATGAVRQPVFRGPYAAHVAVLREALGADLFAASWTEGRGMMLEDAIEDALATALAPAEAIRPA
jgi:tetratricopeptide (TPR) repeat protein